LLSEQSNPKLHAYLEGRSVCSETYKYFGVRYTEWGEIAFPFTSILGNTIGLVFRNVETKKISGLKIDPLTEDHIELPKKARRGAWFGLHLIDVKAPLLIVESEICAMFSYQCGFKNVISPGGMGPTKAQIKAVPNRNIYLGFDSDPAGRSGMERTTNRLGKHKNVWWVDWNLNGNTKDPSDLQNAVEFWACIAKMKPVLTGWLPW
jgi:DNA primase